MKRRRKYGAASNRLLLGSVATLVVVVAVYFSYRATVGLPFVPTYDLTLQVPNADQVVRGDNVSIAGDLVGQVTGVKAEPLAGHRPVADLSLALQKSVGRLPVDSTFTIRLTGTLGRKDVEITPGRSRTLLRSGAVVGLGRDGTAPVDVDQLLSAFNAGARSGIRSSLATLGLGLAGRGQALNDSLTYFPNLLANLTPVMASLADPSTGLSHFVDSLDALASDLAPVAQTEARLFGELDTTFSALGSVSEPYLDQAVADTPATLSTATDDFPTIGRFVRATTVLLRDLHPGTAELPSTAPLLADALQAGAENLPGVPALSRRGTRALNTLASYSGAPSVIPGFERLTLTADSLSPLLSFLTPAQTVCGYPALLVRNLASSFEDRIATGTMARALAIVTGTGLNSERGPASGPYRGGPAKALGPLHASTYPNTAAPGEQPYECTAAKEPYVTNDVVTGNPPGDLGASGESSKLP